MAASDRFISPYVQEIDGNGAPYADGLLYFYVTGTTTPQAVYSDEDLTTAILQPVTADSDGRWSSIYLSPGVEYKVVLKDENAVTIWTADPVSSATGAVRDYETRTVADAASIPASVNIIRLAGYDTVNDAPPHTYKKLSVTPSPVKAWQFQSADGAYWQLNETEPTPEMLGAARDGSTDDTQAMQDTCDFLSGGGTVQLLPGTYKVIDQVEVTTPIKMIGAGKGISIVRATALGATKAIFKVTSSDVTFRDLTLRGPFAGTVVGDEAGIWAYATDGAEIENLVCDNIEVKLFGSYGIVTEFCDRSLIVSCLITECGHGGIINFSSADWKVMNCTVSEIHGTGNNQPYGIATFSRSVGAYVVPRGALIANNHVSNIPWEGIDTHGGRNMTIVGNVIEDCACGISVTYDPGPLGPTSDDTSPRDVSIVGNTINNLNHTGTARFGLGLIGSPGGGSVNCSIVGNTLCNVGETTTDTPGILIQDTDGTVCTGNTVTQSAAWGINLRDINSNLVVSGNVVTGITNGVANASALRVENSLSNSSGMISGNYFDATAEYCIFFTAANTGLQFGPNALVTSNPFKIVAPTFAGRGLELEATLTGQVLNIANTAAAAINVTVAGARAGDFVQASLDTNLDVGVRITGDITANDIVTVYIRNDSGGAYAHTVALYVKVTKKGP